MPYTPRTDFSGVTDMYMDTAAYNVDPMIQNYLLQDIKELDQRRLRAYKYFMNFYGARQWEESGEWNPAYGNKSWIAEEYNRRTWNISRNLVDKLVAFLVKDPWTIKLPKELEEDEGDSTPIKDTLEAVWRANSREKFSYDMAYMGCITGDCFVKVSYDEDFYAEGIGELRFKVLDSRLVIPFFDGEQSDKLVGCRIQYPVFEMQATGEKKKVIYTEIHTESTIATFIDGQLDNTAPNPLAQMMVIHIKNEPLPYQRYGRSDLYDLVLPQKEYNEKLSDISEILAYHASPITVIKGARPQQLERGARKIWGGIPKDGDVFNLTLGDDLASSVDYLDRLKKHLHETAGVPEEALGALQNVSNTSGAALHVQYQPLVERTQKKQIDYGLGLRKLNQIILKFYEAVGAIELPEDVAPSLKYQTLINWGDALPRDRSIDLSDISTEMGLGIESHRGALKRLGEENPDQKLEEIKQEAMDQAEIDFMTTGISGFGDPTAGADGTMAGANDGPQSDVSGAVAQSKTNPVTQGNQTSVQAVKRSAQETTGANKTR